MENKALNITLFLLFLFTMACKFFDPNKSSLHENLISEDEAKSIIIDYIQKSEDYQQYYTLGSPNFDERVRSITWGKTIFVHQLPNKNSTPYFNRERYYYILTGVMPDGHVLDAQLVNAHTGERILGQNFMDADCFVLRMVTPDESIGYARSYIKGDLKCEAIYYYDGTYETGDELLTFRYIVQPRGSDAVARGFTDTNYVLLDPWVKNFKSDNAVKASNSFVSRFGCYHRAFRFNSTRANDYDRKMVPID